MQKIIDHSLTITITNDIYNYDLHQDVLNHHQRTVTRNRKNGYLTYDNMGRRIGIVFMSDDTRTNRYGAAEIMFFKQYKNEYGTWRVIVLEETDSYIMFDKLQKILKEKASYTLTTKSRKR